MLNDLAVESGTLHLTAFAQRSSRQCSAPGCRSRLPAWSGFWGGKRGLFANADWYCDIACLEHGLARAMESSRAQPSTRAPFVNRMPIGLILMARGVITHDQLKLALAERKNSSRPIGQTLMRQVDIEEDDITQAIASQSSCPVLRPSSIHESCIHTTPLELIEKFGMLPVHFSPTRAHLYVGFKGVVDRNILYALEQMLQCHTEPCIISDSNFHLLLEKVRSQMTNQVVIDSYCSSTEIASTVCDYAAKVRNATVRYTTVGESIWIRVAASNHNIDLIFARYLNSYAETSSLKVEPASVR
jgi:hypothetical protein